MKHILITGATGNVGRAILDHFNPGKDVRVFSATHRLPSNENELFFDFTDLRASIDTLRTTDVLFLLRPPGLADVSRYFDPLIRECARQKVSHIIFLSVQGVEKSQLIPHFKIEQLIRNSGIPYTFIRPSYFMQNLTTIFLEDLRKSSLISVPAGKALFRWVDVADVGKAIATILQNESLHAGKVYTITGADLLSFRDVARMIGAVAGRRIRYTSPSLLSFFIQKKRKGLSANYIMVMIVLHYSARFSEMPVYSSDYTMITGEEPTTLKTFLLSNRDAFRVKA